MSFAPRRKSLRRNALRRLTLVRVFVPASRGGGHATISQVFSWQRVGDFRPDRARAARKTTSAEKTSATALGHAFPRHGAGRRGGVSARVCKEGDLCGEMPPACPVGCLRSSLHAGGPVPRVLPNLQPRLRRRWRLGKTSVVGSRGCSFEREEPLGKPAASEAGNVAEPKKRLGIIDACTAFGPGVDNAGKLGLPFRKTFQRDGSPWQIYLYALPRKR